MHGFNAYLNERKTTETDPLLQRLKWKEEAKREQLEQMETL